MKTSIQWTKAICGATNFPINQDGLNIIIEQVQLDAERAGYERGVREAAVVADKESYAKDRSYAFKLGCAHTSATILSLLTKKEDEK